MNNAIHGRFYFCWVTVSFLGFTHNATKPFLTGTFAFYSMSNPEMPANVANNATLSDIQ